LTLVHAVVLHPEE
jgi:hypothetical protein